MGFAPKGVWVMGLIIADLWVMGCNSPPPELVDSSRYGVKGIQELDQEYGFDCSALRLRSQKAAAQTLMPQKAANILTATQENKYLIVQNKNPRKKNTENT